jgi:hypothetical protein
MGELNSSKAETFSLTRGGPVHRLLGRHGDERQRVIRRALLATFIAWFPLLVLSLVEGTAYGPQVRIPFLRDCAVNVRFFIALPILILAESRIDDIWRTLVLQFLRSGLVKEPELSSFDTVLEKITRLRDRALPEALMIFAVYLPSIFPGKTELLMSGISNWHNLAPGSSEVSLAGWWFNLVSIPIFRFLLLRWAWRIFLWTLFLWRVSRINLHLVATHTDMAAGLGFLSEGQMAFSPIVFAGGAVIAGQVGNAIGYEGATLSSVRYLMIAYGAIAIIVLVVPLLAVTPLLLRIKKRAVLDYGALVTRHDQSFAANWMHGRYPAGEALLGNPEASSLADLGTSFTVVREMRLVPIDKRTLISLAVAAVLPMVPIALIVTPANELIRDVLKLLA